jgi:hypothetical protein
MTIEEQMARKGYKPVEAGKENEFEQPAEPAQPANAPTEPKVEPKVEPAAAPKAEVKNEPAEPIDELAIARKYLKENGIDFEDAEKLKKRIAHSIDEDDELFVKEYEYLKKGGKKENWNKVYGTDPEKNTPFENAVNDLILKNPELTRDEAEFKIKRTYKIGEEGQYDEDDVKDGQISLKLHNKELINRIKEERDKFEIPVEEKNRIENERKLHETIKDFKKNVDETLKDYDGITVKIADPEDSAKLIDFKIGFDTPEEKKEFLKTVKSVMDDPDNAFVLPMLLNKATGKDSYLHLANDLFRYLNGTKIAKEAAEYGALKANKKWDDFMNTVTPPRGTTERNAPPKPTETPKQAIRRQLKDQGMSFR